MAAVMAKCRLCLRLGDFDSIFGRDGSVQLIQMAMACASIKITNGDGMSDKVCSECVQNVRKAYFIRQQFERAERELRQELATTSGSNGNFRQTNPNHQRSSSTSTSGLSKQEGRQGPSFTSSGAPAPQNIHTPTDNGQNTFDLSDDDLEDIEVEVQSNSETEDTTDDDNNSSNNESRNRGILIQKSERDTSDGSHSESKSKDPMLFADKHLKTCNKGTPKKGIIKTRENKEKPKKKQTKCKLCIAKFDTAYMLNKHMQVDHAAEVAKLFEKLNPLPKGPKVAVPCLYCSVTIDTYLKYRKHFNMCVLKDESMPVHCAICSKVFNGQTKGNAYMNHVKKEHFCESGTNAVYKCRVCHVTIKNRDLGAHFGAHKFKAPVKDGAGASGLTKKGTPGSGQPKAPSGTVYRCKLCPKVFKQVKRLENHKLLEHTKKAAKARNLTLNPIMGHMGSVFFL